LEIASEYGAIARGFRNRSAGSGLALHERVGNRNRRDDENTQGGRGNQPSYEPPVAHPPVQDRKRDRRARDANPPDDTVVNRADRLKPQDQSQRNRVGSPLCIEQTMEEKKGERKKVERLELNVDEMREMVRREAEDQAGDIRRALAAGQSAGEHVHRKRREDERNKQQQGVTEDEVVGK